MATTEQLRCETKGCKSIAPKLYQLGPLFVCAVCVPDSAWKEYPKWQERKADALRRFNTRNTRSALAKKNFKKETAHA